MKRSIIDDAFANAPGLWSTAPAGRFIASCVGATLLLFVDFGNAFPQSWVAHEPQPKEEAKKEYVIARATTELYVKAASMRDLDATMKLVDVPFCLGPDVVLRDKDQLKKAIGDVFKEQENLNEPKKIPVFRILKVGTLAEFVKEFPKLSDTSLPQVLSDGDRLVLVRVELTKEKRTKDVLLGIRLKNGKGFVAAIS